MKNIKVLIPLILFSALFISCATKVNVNQSYRKPMLKKPSLNKIKTYSKAEKKVLSKADRLLIKKFRSITDKKAIPPSGDKHDYYSRAIYYWPDSISNSNKWKFVDGKVNRKSLEKTDHFTFFEAMGAIRDLSLAYHLSNNEKYTQKVFQIINQWFVNENTKMNPNFNYSQAIPGKNNGSHWGIISSRAIIWVIDGLELINQSISFNNNIVQGFKNWCSDFLVWLTTSKFGKEESATKNNHATFYSLQVAKLADFTGETEICFDELNRVKEILIHEQIKKDGTMPAELARAKPIQYSLFNLSAFFHLAMLGDKYNLDLWNAKTDSSGSIMDAFNFVLNEIERVKNKNNMKVSYSYVGGLLTIADSKFTGLYELQLNKLLKKNKKLRLIDNYFPF